MDNSLKCVREMLRVTKDKLTLVDINKKGERIMNRVPLFGDDFNRLNYFYSKNI